MRFLYNLYRWLRALFLHGLFTILPITATIVVIHFVYSLLAKWLTPLKELAPLWMQSVPAVEFFIVTITLLFAGALFRSFLFSPIIKWFDDLIDRIPFIRIVYSSSKLLVDFFNVPESASDDKQVVLVEYPQKGCYCIAFLLGSAQDNFQMVLPHDERTNKRYGKVFMPNSPNPTTGFFMIVSSCYCHRCAILFTMQ